MRNLNTDFTLKSCLFGSVQGLQGLDYITLTAEAKYPINFTQSEKISVLSLHYHGSNSFLFVNTTKIYQFKAKYSEIKSYALCLVKTSKDFWISNMKKTRLIGIFNFFSVDFNPNDANNILDINKYLIKGIWYEIMFGLIKKIFIRLLTDIVSASNHTKCILLSNQKCMIQHSLINLHHNECSQEFHEYPFAVKLDICVGSCNTLKELSNKVCVPNKTEDFNLRVFNMTNGIN